jgi:hypothetical protein
MYEVSLTVLGSIVHGGVVYVWGGGKRQLTFRSTGTEKPLTAGDVDANASSSRVQGRALAVITSGHIGSGGYSIMSGMLWCGERGSGIVGLRILRPSAPPLEDEWHSTGLKSQPESANDPPGGGGGRPWYNSRPPRIRSEHTTDKQRAGEYIY